MSSKSTIVSGNNFHLYKELFEKDAIYLTLNKEEFFADWNSVTVRIPIEIWEVIRSSYKKEFLYLNLSSKEIKDFVIKRVEKRIKAYKSSSSNTALWTVDAGIFGAPDSPKEEQIKKGIKYYSDLKTKEKKVFNLIKKLKKDY